MSEIEDDAASSDDSLRWVKKLSKTMLPLCAQPSPPGGPLCGPRPRKFPASAQQKVGVGARHAGKWSGARSSPDLTRPLPRVTGSRGRRGHVATRSEQPRAGSGAGRRDTC